MKKICLFMLVMVLSLTLLGCGQSEAAKAVDEKIAAIGTVTLDSESAILAAEQAVSRLEEKDKNQLKLTDTLSAARETYDTLVLNAKAAEVDAVISKIGTVTLDSEKAISAARKAYKDCEEDVKPLVSNMRVLEEAEEEFERLKIAQVVQSINEIGTVTADSGDAILIARNLFNALSKESAAKVENAQVLQNALKEIVRILEEQVENNLKKLTTDADPFSVIAYYHAKGEPQYINTRSFAIPYIGINDNGETHLFTLIDYVGNSWVFFKKVIFSIDGQITTKQYDYFSDIHRDNAYGKVWEYVNHEEAGDAELFWSIANSKQTMIRFEGDDRYDDFTVSKQDKEAIREVLTAYESVKTLNMFK